MNIQGANFLSSQHSENRNSSENRHNFDRNSYQYFHVTPNQRIQILGLYADIATKIKVMGYLFLALLIALIMINIFYFSEVLLFLIMSPLACLSVSALFYYLFLINEKHDAILTDSSLGGTLSFVLMIKIACCWLTLAVYTFVSFFMFYKIFQSIMLKTKDKMGLGVYDTIGAVIGTIEAALLLKIAQDMKKSNKVIEETLNLADYD